MSTWFDRPLSVAGRILARENERIVSKLVNVDRDLLIIPSLAIHMNRGVNDGYKFNIQKDLLPCMVTAKARDIYESDCRGSRVDVRGYHGP